MLVCVLGLVLALSTQGEAAGPQQGVEIGGVVYEYVDPGEPFQEAPRPVQNWQPPQPNQAEQAAGMLAYVTSDPGEYRPYRIPKPEEHVTQLTAFLTPGEVEPVWIGVWALAPLRGLRATASFPEAPLSVDVRHLHFWPQRTGWRSRQWYITPELILPCADGKKTVPARRGVLEQQSFDVAEGETAAFWLTLTAQDDAAPGVYEGTVTLGGEDRPPLVLPIRVEVLPFRLQKPADRYWLLYADVFRWSWGRLSDEQIVAELKDFARHGITGLVEVPLGTADLSEISAGRARFDAGAYRRIAELCQRAGLPGPHVCALGGWPERVRDALGIQCDLGRQRWPDEIREGLKAVARAAVEATADIPQRWYFYGVDEPAGDNTYAIQDYQAWHDGGALTYATFFDPGFLAQAKEFLTAPCFGVGLVSSETTARAAREACEKTGTEFWWYGTGSYVNPYPQETFMFHNRYGAGYLFWKTGAKAQVSWTFCRPHEDVFNDFDGSQANPAEPKEQATAYPHLLRPDDWTTYQGAIPTIAWEALREGIDDYRYLYTLSQTIQQAKDSPNRRARELANRAQETMDALVEAIPWANPMVAQTFETDRMQRVRREVANLIVELRGALSGQRDVKTEPRTARITLRIRTVPLRTAEHLPLPALAVARVDAPPRVDGLLDDQCWEASQAAADFRDIYDGAPAPAPTRAWLVQDDRALYVAFECAEPFMDKLVAERTGRDPYLVWMDDGIEFFIAGEDRRRYAHLIVNTHGAVYDEICQDPTWNPQVDVAVHKAEGRWSVEFVLPWAELEKAGIRRAPLMAVNFCRNRFTTKEDAAHTAWSCTYGGFHTPERFGLADLRPGPVTLASVGQPAYWGRQVLPVELRNNTAAPLDGWARAGHGETRVVAIPPHASVVAHLPLTLAKPGPGSVVIEWGVKRGQPRRVELAVNVPEPVSAGFESSLVADGDEVPLPIQVAISPEDQRSFRLQVSTLTSVGRQLVALPAKPRRSKSVSASVRGLALVRISLLDEQGKEVPPAIERRLVVLGTHR